MPGRFLSLALGFAPRFCYAQSLSFSHPLLPARLQRAAGRLVRPPPSRPTTSGCPPVCPTPPTPSPFTAPSSLVGSCLPALTLNVVAPSCSFTSCRILLLPSPWVEALLNPGPGLPAGTPGLRVLLQLMLQTVAGQAHEVYVMAAVPPATVDPEFERHAELLPMLPQLRVCRQPGHPADAGDPPPGAASPAA